jgi:hypothetical protein
MISVGNQNHLYLLEHLANLPEHLANLVILNPDVFHRGEGPALCLWIAGKNQCGSFAPMKDIGVQDDVVVAK